MTATSSTDAAAKRERFYTVPEVASLLKVSVLTVYRAIRTGELPAVRLRRRYSVPAEAIDRLEAKALAGGPTLTAELPALSPTPPLNGGTT